MVAPLLVAAIPAIAGALGGLLGKAKGGGESAGGGMAMPSFQGSSMLQSASPLMSQNAQLQATQRNKMKSTPGAVGMEGM